MIQVDVIAKVIEDLNVDYAYSTRPFFMLDLDTEAIVDENTPHLDQLFLEHNLIPINVTIFHSDIVYAYLTQNENKEYYATLDMAYKGQERFKKFKKALRELGLLDDFYEFKHKYYRTAAITWLVENNISFQK